MFWTHIVSSSNFLLISPKFTLGIMSNNAVIFLLWILLVSLPHLSNFQSSVMWHFVSFQFVIPCSALGDLEDFGNLLWPCFPHDPICVCGGDTGLQSKRERTCGFIWKFLVCCCLPVKYFWLYMSNGSVYHSVIWFTWFGPCFYVLKKEWILIRTASKMQSCITYIW